MRPILHITTEAQWEQAVRQGTYTAPSLAREGFIHCSRPEQILTVANAAFAGRLGLLLLVIDPTQVGPEIRYEGVPGGELYPHIYGPLAVNAVMAVYPFAPSSSGTFVLPAVLSEPMSL